ncbi:MAG TPA: hypothetical protein VH251_08805 [Verrucomicrobiae bacterium]|jgi:hypothetical protein|nr:hypothetical protein [Verrucomicrobiae bacterium]
MKASRIPLPSAGDPQGGAISWRPAWHARRQMAQDAWCLVLGVCNFSRHQVHGQGWGEALRSNVWPVAVDYGVTPQSSAGAIRVRRNV